MMTVALLNHDHDSGRTYVFALPLVATIKPTGANDTVTTGLAYIPDLGASTFGDAIKQVLDLCKEDTGGASAAAVDGQGMGEPTGGPA